MYVSSPTRSEPRATTSAGCSIWVLDPAVSRHPGRVPSRQETLPDPATDYAKHPGGAPSDRPADSDIWVAQAAGAGTQSLTWPLDEGSWTVVVMNADGSGDVDVNVDVGATAPIQPDVARWLQIGSIPLGVIGLILVLAAARRSRRQRTVAGHPS